MVEFRSIIGGLLSINDVAITIPINYGILGLLDIPLTMPIGTTTAVGLPILYTASGVAISRMIFTAWVFKSSP